MIPTDFTYYRPETAAEAVEVYAGAASEGKNAFYYAGGSEIITMARAGSICPHAVIDIKRIEELKELTPGEKWLTIGAACTLNQIKESNLFPLLSLSCGRIADHTNQCRITLGGNICGSIIYREASLPLLLADAELLLIGPNGRRHAAAHSIFRSGVDLLPGELVTGVRVPNWALGARHAHIKKTAGEKIDYPLLSIAALWEGKNLRAAFSGVCSYPFRNAHTEAILNERALSAGERARRAVEALPQPPYCDVEGTGEYRAFLMQNTLETLLEDWENDRI